MCTVNAVGMTLKAAAEAAGVKVQRARRWSDRNRGIRSGLACGDGCVWSTPERTGSVQ